jgi:tetratricopeptide (TPR) repeat protein
MRTKFIFIALFTISSTFTYATDTKFVEAMEKNIKLVYEARDIAAFQQSVNAFERIAETEKTRWEPFYYIGFGYVMMANLETDLDKKDLYLDRALEAVEKGKAINANESELVALEGFAYMLKITVDPPTRGMVYAPRATQTFEKAIGLNPENPRAIAMLAQMQFGSAKFFNGSTTEACATNIKALEKFTTYKSENPLAPVWGLRMAEGLRDGCK